MPTEKDLRDFIVDHFSPSELDEFCYDYFREAYTNFRGADRTLPVYARELVDFLKRRDDLDELIVRLQLARPKPFQRKFQSSEGRSGTQVPPSAGGGEGGGGYAKPQPKVVPAATPPTPGPSHPSTSSGRAEGRSQSPKTIWIHDPLEMQFMRVDAGEFLMGSDKAKDPDAYDDELPQHKVYLDEFYMGKTPVTNAQYAVFAKATGEKFELLKGKDDHPVVRVSWNDANAFCEWLNKAQNIYKVALPTEAQWEKAARGEDGWIYPWGNQKPDKNLCNFGDNEGGITPVGKYSPQGDSPYECADMVGNVWEWCADWFDANAYAKHTERNPAGPAKGTGRVLRGGSWFDDLRIARCAARLWNLPDLRGNLIGFRVVCVPIFSKNSAL